MRALSILRQSLDAALGFMHRRRREALWCAVAALIRGGRLSLTELGRSVPRHIAHKHSIKTIDRLLGNPHLKVEAPGIYAALAERVLRGQRRPRVLVDWTPVGLGSLHYALVASVPVGGRAITLYAEVHPEARHGNSRVEASFLRTLAWVLPRSCCPVVVTDAGFRTPWFDAVRRQGWDYVGRLFPRTMVKGIADDTWSLASQLFAAAPRRALDLGPLLVNRSRCRSRRLVLIDQRRPARQRRVHRTRRGQPTQSKRAKKNQRREQQPWLLATSVDDIEADDVVAIYRTRMQIEETFRDLKSHRFGWSMQDARCRVPERYEVLLLVGALAAVAVSLIGTMAEALGLQRRYQANTVRQRRTLSLMRLGRLAFGNGDDRDWTATDLSKALQALLSPAGPGLASETTR